MKSYIRRATAEDAAWVADNMRPEDVAEAAAASGASPRAALFAGLFSSDLAMALVDPDTGKAGAILGVVRGDEGVGYIWMLGTSALERRSVTFLRRCRVVLDGLNAVYPVLTNCVDARNEVHIRWLKWLGFTFLRLIPDHGAEQRPFYEFARIPTNV